MTCHDNNQSTLEMLHRLSREMAAIHMEVVDLKLLVCQKNATMPLDTPLQNNKSVKTHKPRVLKNFSERDTQTAKFILDTIRMAVPIKEPNLNDWANTVRLMRTADKRTDEDIRGAICTFAKDAFWSTTCLSAKNLRKNFDRVTAVKAGEKRELADTGESLDKYRGEF